MHRAEKDFLLKNPKKSEVVFSSRVLIQGFPLRILKKAYGENFPQGAGAFFPENTQRAISLPSAHSATLFKKVEDFENRGPPLPDTQGSGFFPQVWGFFLPYRRYLIQKCQK